MNIFKKIFSNKSNDKKEVITMTNTEKSLALINTFSTGDTEKASVLLAENYIQHNLAYGTGRDAFVGSVAYLASAPVKTTVNNIRAFEDGDKVFLQTIYNFAGASEQVAFDIFRFDENGKIAEHWDNLANKAELNPSGHTQTDGTKEIKDLDKTEANRELVKNFLYDVMQGNCQCGEQPNARLLLPESRLHRQCHSHFFGRSTSFEMCRNYAKTRQRRRNRQGENHTCV